MSTTREARALARAGRAANTQQQPPQPVDDPNDTGDELSEEQIVGTTNRFKYSDPDYFSDMLQRIGVSRACITQLANDDFNSMKSIVMHYRGNVTDRLVAVIHHFIQAVYCFHTIPDIKIIGREEAIELIDPYQMYKQFSEGGTDEEMLIELPDLKGHENWISYRDKFISNLHVTPGSNGTPLSYVINDNPKSTKRANQAYNEIPSIQLNSWEFYAENIIHYGSHFKADNSKVWHLLKRSLLGNQPYHHIDHCARQENGRLAWDSLRSYYKGEDYVNKTIQECLTRVRTMYYRCETPRFNFEKFIDKQKECYKKLRDVGYNNGEGVDDASKCSNLKQMILPDAHLETALSMARTQGLFNGRFDDLVHFLKAEVDELTLRRTQHRANRSHRVSSVGATRNAGRGSRGRGGRGGRGGIGPNRRYQPRTGGNRTILTRFVDGR